MPTEWDSSIWGSAESDLVIQTQKKVFKERERQFTKWGSQAQKSDHVWALILMEEFGELVDESLSQHSKEAFIESVQLAAVANAWSEAFEQRDTKHEFTPYPTSVMLMFSKMGLLSKALLEEKYTDASIYSTELIKEINYFRNFITKRNHSLGE